MIKQQRYKEIKEMEQNIWGMSKEDQQQYEERLEQLKQERAERQTHLMVNLFALTEEEERIVTGKYNA